MSNKNIHTYNHKSVSLTVVEIWLIEIFQGQIDLDLISQDHPKSNHLCAIACPSNLNGLQGKYQLPFLS